nr:pentatricopeptide repeat-containing protein At1g09190 [Ipomoea batatas]
MRRAVERRILSLLHGQSTRTHLTQIHAHILRHLLHNSNQVLTHFVSVCGSQNKMDYANIIFQHFPYPNIFLFNSMIKGFSLCGPFLNSIALFSGMKNRGIWADEYTLAPLLKASSNLPDLRLGQAVHKEAIVLGFHRFTSIGIGIVELYSSCDRMVDAKRVFDEMSPRDVIVWNLMVQGYCRSGNVEMGLRVFRQMDERSIVSWNMMISWLARSGRDKEALELFREMNGNGFEADEATVVTVLPICARLGEIEVGSWIHSYVDSKGLIGDYVSVGNALVDFYCKCGDLEPASLIFKDMAGKNVVSWNAMISGLAFNGKAELGVQLFDNMISEGTRPNESTFVGVLACCTHAGLVQRGRDLFASMITKYDIEPTLEHYGCMVDLLGRNGHVKEAYDLIKSMPMKPNAAALWGSLLSALRTHGDMELAECTAKELISLEPWNSGNYVLLSNIYAEQGKWDEVEQVRELMRERNIMKEAGQSMVG